MGLFTHTAREPDRECAVIISTVSLNRGSGIWGGAMSRSVTLSFTAMTNQVMDPRTSCP